MKKNYLLVIGAAMMLAISMSSCSSDDNGLFKMRNVSNSGCKYTRAEGGGEMLYDIYETIGYKGLDNGYLSLNHENAVFNCEPGELKMQGTISGNEINILEAEESAGANCMCLYDLYCEVGPLEEGKVYTIVVFHDGVELDRFSITYRKGLSGTSYVQNDYWEHHSATSHSQKPGL